MYRILSQIRPKIIAPQTHLWLHALSLLRCTEQKHLMKLPRVI
jgi:hypothetical protein